MKRLFLGLAPTAATIVAFAGLGAAQAQDDNDYVPNTNPNLSCAHFNAEALSGDASAMQALSGTWRQQNDIPGTPGVSMPTTEERITTRNPDGTLFYEATACFQPVQQQGSPALAPSCAKAIGHGRWFARPADSEWIVVGVMTQGSGYGGNMTGVNCSIVRVHFIDDSVLENEFGGRGERIQAPN